MEASLQLCEHLYLKREKPINGTMEASGIAGGCGAMSVRVSCCIAAGTTSISSGGSRISRKGY